MRRSTMEEQGIVRGDGDFWTRARRHLLKYGGEFVDFVPVRAEGAFLYDDAGRRVLDFTSDQMSAVLGQRPVAMLPRSCRIRPAPCDNDAEYAFACTMNPL